MTKTPSKKGRRAELNFDELPEGWIKEEKSRLKTPTKKDPFYIELKSGYAFRSMKDVQKYIKNGNISSCLSRPILMSQEQIASLRNKNSASGSPIEPASRSGSKPGRKSSSNKLTLKRKRSPLKREAPPSDKNPDASEPGNTEGCTATPRPKRERKTGATPVRASPRLAGVRTPITTADQEPIGSSVTPPADVATDVVPDADVATDVEPVADVATDVDPVADVAVDVGPIADVAADTEPKPDPLNGSETETLKEEVVPQTENPPTIEGLFKDQQLAGSSLPGGGPGAGEQLEQNQPGGGPGAGDELIEQNPGGGPGAGDELMEQNPGGGPGAGDELMGPPISSLFGDFWQDSCLGFAFKTLTGDMDGIEIPLDLGLETDDNANVGPSNGAHNDNENDNENGDEGPNDDGAPNEASNETRDDGGAK